MTKQVDKNISYMKETWGTDFLASEYGWENKLSSQKLLREVVGDDIEEKKHDFTVQNQLHAKIRNDVDYDDWEYGTEPLYG
jgi:hypothetical protein